MTSRTQQSVATTPMHVFPALGETRAAWEILGVSREASMRQLDQAYQQHAKQRPPTDSRLGVLRQAWKALRDECYRPMTLRGASWVELSDAGLFDDGLDPRSWSQLFEGLGEEEANDCEGAISREKACPCPHDSVSPLLWQTPWSHLDPKTAAQHPMPVVLLAMGSFAPFHDGHRAMLQAAQAAAETAGWGVVGGWVSPSHEHYVEKKANGLAAWSAEARVQSLREALHAETLWAVDPWEARAPCPLNFSDVARRLKRYLKQLHSGWSRVRVAVVFGSDNAGFARAFAQEGLAIVVERNPNDWQARTLVAQAQQSNPGVLWVRPAAQTQSLSSTQMRKDADWRERALRGAGVGQPAWQPGRGREQKRPPERAVHTLGEQILRDDGPRVWSHWIGVGACEQEQKAWTHAWDDFKSDLLEALKSAWSEQKACPTWVVESTEEQARWAQRAGRGRRWLCLDAGCSEATGLARWDLSREFACSDSQQQAKGWVSRLECTSFAQQAQALAAYGTGVWCAVDDDVSSGGTLQAAQDGLPPGHVLRGALTLTGASGRQRHKGKGWWLYDVMDLRDWLLGAVAGGLTVALPDGRLGRVPYIAPWVNLCARAGLPAVGVAGFTRDWAQANARFFAAAPRAVCVQDFPEAAQKVWLAMGWRPQSSVQELLRWIEHHGHASSPSIEKKLCTTRVETET